MWFALFSLAHLVCLGFWFEASVISWTVECLVAPYVDLWIRMSTLFGGEGNGQEGEGGHCPTDPLSTFRLPVVACIVPVCALILQLGLVLDNTALWIGSASCSPGGQRKIADKVTHKRVLWTALGHSRFLMHSIGLPLSAWMVVDMTASIIGLWTTGSLLRWVSMALCVAWMVEGTLFVLTKLELQETTQFDVRRWTTSKGSDKLRIVLPAIFLVILTIVAGIVSIKFDAPQPFKNLTVTGVIVLLANGLPGKAGFIGSNASEVMFSFHLFWCWTSFLL